MKARVKTIFICLLGATLLLGVNFLLLVFEGTVIERISNIIIGISTGLIVSFIIELTAYFHEKSKFFINIFSKSFGIYQFLLTTEMFTNKLIQKIELGMEPLEEIDFKNVNIGISLALQNKNDINIFEYNRLSLCKRKNKTLKQLFALENFLQNINILNNLYNQLFRNWQKYQIMKAKKEAEILQYKINTKSDDITGLDLSTFNYAIDNLRTAIIGLSGEIFGTVNISINELENHILSLYGVFSYQESWEKVKGNITKQYNITKSFMEKN